jgi:hypothetical protein
VGEGNRKEKQNFSRKEGHNLKVGGVKKASRKK